MPIFLISKTWDYTEAIQKMRELFHEHLLEAFGAGNF